MDSTVKPPKETGKCAVCWDSFKIQKKDGTLHKHGRGGAKGACCPGSYRPPAAISQQPNAYATQTSNPADRNNVPTTSTAAAHDSSPIIIDSRPSVLNHPKWVGLMTRVPKAARANCAQLFTTLLKNIVATPNNNESWNDLLLFGSTILVKPKRGGKTRNLASIINKRVAAWKGDSSASTVEDKSQHRKINRSGEDSQLAAAITSKIQAGNMRAAIRLLCSDDKPAPTTAETLEKLKMKHPDAPPDRKTPCDPTGNTRFVSFQVEAEDVHKSLKTFPAGSSGGPDGLTPQHLLDMIAGAPDEKLLEAVTDFTNVLLSGKLSTTIREVIFGGRLIALQKKDGGIRPIAVGYTLRRLAAKCANSYALDNEATISVRFKLASEFQVEPKLQFTQFAESSIIYRTIMY